MSSYQHGGPQIKLVEELSDEDMHLEDVGDVLVLHVFEDVDEPLKVPMRGADPQEVDLEESYTQR